MIIKCLALIYRYLNTSNELYEQQKPREKYNIHPTFIFNGEKNLMYGEGDILIGENSFIRRHSSIQVTKGYQVRIGKNCKMAFVLKYGHKLRMSIMILIFILLRKKSVILLLAMPYGLGKMW